MSVPMFNEEGNGRRGILNLIYGKRMMQDCADYNEMWDVEAIGGGKQHHVVQMDEYE